MTQPTRKVVFVFGSNLAGIHGAGAAREAALYWGAQRGVGIGMAGKSYAIPTKDHNVRTLALETISEFFTEFMMCVRDNPVTQFLLTPIGTGLAGYTIDQISRVTLDLHQPLPRNIWLTRDWFRG